MNQPNRGLTPIFGVPRTRCDHDQAPLWCLMLGGIPVSEYLMWIAAAMKEGITPSVRSDR